MHKMEASNNDDTDFSSLYNNPKLFLPVYLLYLSQVSFSSYGCNF